MAALRVRVGLHVSIAGRIYESLDRARGFGCTAMQIFSRNPRGWSVAPLDESDAREFRRRKEAYGIGPVVVHIPYLINLASPDDALYEKSIRAYIDDIRRADLLGAEYFVTHLGSHVGSGIEKGIARFAAAVDRIMEEAEPRATILLENTAGSGDSIGSKFEHIAEIVSRIRRGKRVGFCIDTAHTFAAGYDIRSATALERTIKEFDRALGIDRARVVHFNDSMSGFGSHVDRHEHIGKGELGGAALKRIIRHPALRHAAFIMETPKKTDKDDAMNMAAVKRML